MTNANADENRASEGGKTRSDTAYWAQPVTKLAVGAVPAGAVNLNVDGRRVTGPVQGFGKLWRKTYRVDLTATKLTPSEIVAVWKENFPRFWPSGNSFYAPLCGIAPGEVALINSDVPGGFRMSTWVLVIYADDESFTLMTPQGHPFAGWVTFCALQENGRTWARIRLLIRANDPLWELMMGIAIHRIEDRHWQQTLGSLAREFGVDAPVESETVSLDRTRQWSRAGNIWYNAAIRSGLYQLAVVPPRAARLGLRAVRRLRRPRRVRVS